MAAQAGGMVRLDPACMLYCTGRPLWVSCIVVYFARCPKGGMKAAFMVGRTILEYSTLPRSAVRLNSQGIQTAVKCAAQVTHSIRHKCLPLKNGTPLISLG